MNLHFVNDEKFINGAIDLFEKYAPGKNIFILNTNQKTLKFVKLRKEVIVMRISDISNVNQIIKMVADQKINHLYVHYLSSLKAGMANILKKKYNLKTFWIFYGADLYGMLQRDFGYKLQDYPLKKENNLEDKIRTYSKNLKFLFVYKSNPKKATINFIQQLDYFCFWNNYDFELLKKYYHTQAELIPFAYFDAIDGRIKERPNPKEFKIIINNSASQNGNHETLLREIHKIDTQHQIEELIVPLSYGNETIKKNVVKLGTDLFGKKFNPLLEFLDRDTYFNLFNEVSVAFFGARRQEAAGNIFQLLATGVKVFLRNENNMMEYLKEKGFLVFSFEDDFKSMEDLTPLKIEQIQINLQAAAILFSNYNEKAIMKKIINP